MQISLYRVGHHLFSAVSFGHIFVEEVVKILNMIGAECIEFEIGLTLQRSPQIFGHVDVCSSHHVIVLLVCHHPFVENRFTQYSR